MRAANEARAEARSRAEGHYPGGLSVDGILQRGYEHGFKEGAEWQASRDVAELAAQAAQTQAAQATIGRLRLISNVNGDWNVKYATAKRDGWDEGYSRGRADHCDWWGGPDECDVSTPNPYRASIEQTEAE